MLQKTQITNPFTTMSEDNCNIVIGIKDRVEVNEWYLYFGYVQKIMLAMTKSNIIIDLSKCVFYAPDPFLSLCLTLHSCKYDNQNDIKVILPQIGEEKYNRFLKYCVREGFYRLLQEVDSRVCGLDDFDIKTQGVINARNYHPIIPAQIIPIIDTATPDELAQRLVENIVSFGFELDVQTKKEILIIFSNVLFELIDNVKTHAYEEKEYKKTKLFAIYARARYETFTTRNQGLKENRINKSTLIPPEALNFDAIEIYFMDLGIGLVKSCSRKEGFSSLGKRPLRTLFQALFFKPGESRRSIRERLKKTNQSGLQIIKELLLGSDGIIKLTTEGETIGEFVRNPEYTNPQHSFSISDFLDDCNNEDYNHVGLTISIFLPLRGNSNLTYLNQENIISELPTYKKPLSRDLYKKMKVADNRPFSAKTNNFDIFNNNSTTLFYFISTSRYKQEIIRKLKKQVKDNPNLKTLLICDIEVEEWVVFSNTLDNSTVNILSDNVDEIIALEEIIIIGHNYRTMRYEIDIKKRIFKFDKNYSFKKLNAEHNYLYQLKLYETSVLLALLNEMGIEEYALTKGAVLWGDTIIPGFINFEFLVSNSRTFEFLRHNLIRIFYMLNCSELRPIEIMVHRLTEEINGVYGCLKKDGKPYHLGSVYMSGSTLLSTTYNTNECIHFFDRSKKEEASGIISVFFSPNRMLGDNGITEMSTPEYERVGKTQKIRAISESRKRIITNSYLSQIETNKLLHRYQYPTFGCGHYVYEERHSLFIFDFKSILDDPSTKLNVFLNSLIVSSLGHYMGDKSYNKDRYWNIFQDTCMIIYLSHHFSEETLQKCGYENEYAPYILGLNHRNVLRHGESLEFSDVFTRYISDKINSFMTLKNQNAKPKAVKFVVFDSIISSGRTRKEIKQYLRNLGGDTVLFASIIDTQGYRFDKPDTYRCYIDLNFPTLSRSNSCAICEAIEKLGSCSKYLLSYQMLDCIDNLIAKWHVKEGHTANSLLTLSPFKEIAAEEFEITTGNYNYDNLKFTKAIPLYFYLSHRIRLENDLFIFENFLNNNADFEKNSLVFLCSAFLIEYKEACYHRLLKKVFCMILDSYDGVTSESVSELALIALVSIDTELQRSLFSDYLLERMDRIPQILFKQIYYAINYSVITSAENNSLLRASFGLAVKIGNTLRDTYRQFHCQLVNTHGELHDPPLRRILTNYNDKTKSLLISSLSLLKSSVSSGVLDFFYLFENPSMDEYEDVRGKLLKAIGGMTDNGVYSDSYEKTKAKIDELYKYAMKLHSALYARVNLECDNKGGTIITDALDRIVDEYNQEAVKKVYFYMSYGTDSIDPGKASDIYYIWNPVLKREIIYTMTNVNKYAQDVIFNSDGEDFYGVIEIHLKDSAAIIEISNTSQISANEINLKLKERYGISAIRSLGIELCYEEVEPTKYDKNIINSNKCVVRAVFKIPNIEFMARKEDSQ